MKRTIAVEAFGHLPDDKTIETDSLLVAGMTRTVRIAWGMDKSVAATDGVATMRLQQAKQGETSSSDYQHPRGKVPAPGRLFLLDQKPHAHDQSNNQESEYHQRSSYRPNRVQTRRLHPFH